MLHAARSEAQPAVAPGTRDLQCGTDSSDRFHEKESDFEFLLGKGPGIMEQMSWKCDSRGGPGLWVCSLLLCVWTVAPAVALDFERDILPILQANCFDCHTEGENAGELRLDRLASMLRGGNSGEPAIVPGNPQASFLLRLLRHQEPGLEMPPDSPALSAAEILKIEDWIASGAETPASYGPATEAIPLEHWSFRAIERPPRPASLDGFIVDELSRHGLTPAPRAERRVLIRRLHLVMLGLPPQPSEVEAFENDDHPLAWEHLVERVLASPRYGERLASLWLDLVRFGETNGFETNRERPNAWPYRDWIIDCLNQDQAYDQFVRQQLAGDSFDAPLGTGFLVAGPYDIVQGQDKKLKLMQRQNELDDMINTCGTAFLGLTTGCARCHNHKFDPISQQDYYALQAVFAGVTHAESSVPLSAVQQIKLAELDQRLSDTRESLQEFFPRLADQAGWQEPVNPSHNVEIFAPRQTRLVRFTIRATNGGAPCIDELQIYAGGVNVAAAERGAMASSSGDFQHPKHKLEHINDGQFGNSRSWISAEERGGWVQIELPAVTRIERIEWARDRTGEFADRLPIEYEIEYMNQDMRWETLSSSDHRRPYSSADSIPQAGTENCRTGWIFRC